LNTSINFECSIYYIIMFTNVEVVKNKLQLFSNFSINLLTRWAQSTLG